MLYAVIATDAPNSLQDRLATRPAHLARLEQLKNEGRLVLAGPHPAIDSNDPGEAGFSGSLVVAEFDSLEAAQQWAGQALQESAALSRHSGDSESARLLVFHGLVRK